MAPLACATIVFRAMARKAWVDQAAQTVLPAAFIRRPPPRDAGGLSVNIDSPESCAAALHRCYGVATLHVGRMRDLALDVEVDAAPHANITGIPRDIDDRTRAEHLASRLARQARLIVSP
jgi:hypothetical protein